MPVSDAPFAVIGDFQRTAFQECVLGREVNDDETELIVAAVASSSPTFIAILGDLVFNGKDPQHWEHFDHVILPITKQNIPMFPVPGNHDYCSDNMYMSESSDCDNSVAFDSYHRRFPQSSGRFPVTTR
jgi:metallophosphoesterase superfamily enzyme